MLRVDLLIKILYKPREVFEELKGGTGWKDGFLVYAACSILGLVFFLAGARLTGWDISIINFGFGTTLIPAMMLIAFVVDLGLLLLLSALSHIFAGKLGGDGDFSEVFGMFGYSQALSIVKGLVAAAGVVWLNTQFWLETNAAIGMGDITVSNFFEMFAFGILIINMIFLVWTIWIRGTAVAVSQGISIVRGVAAVLLAVVALDVILLAVLFVGGIA